MWVSRKKMRGISHTSYDISIYYIYIYMILYDINKYIYMIVIGFGCNSGLIHRTRTRYCITVRTVCSSPGHIPTALHDTLHEKSL